MAAIKQRKTKYSVIYWYVNEQGERKQNGTLWIRLAKQRAARSL